MQNDDRMNHCLLADEQKSDIRLSHGAEWTQDHEGNESAWHSKSCGCVVTVHVLIWGDLRRERSKDSARNRNILRDVSEVSSGHSSGTRGMAQITKDQRNRTRQRLDLLVPIVACVKREERSGV